MTRLTIVAAIGVLSATIPLPGQRSEGRGRDAGLRDLQRVNALDDLLARVLAARDEQCRVTYF